MTFDINDFGGAPLDENIVLILQYDDVIEQVKMPSMTAAITRFDDWMRMVDELNDAAGHVWDATKHRQVIVAATIRRNGVIMKRLGKSAKLLLDR